MPRTLRAANAAGRCSEPRKNSTLGTSLYMHKLFFFPHPPTETPSNVLWHQLQGPCPWDEGCHDMVVGLAKEVDGKYMCSQTGCCSSISRSMGVGRHAVGDLGRSERW